MQNNTLMLWKKAPQTRTVFFCESFKLTEGDDGMSTADIVRTIIEFLAIAVAIVAMINEERFIVFEDRVVNFSKNMWAFSAKRSR